MNFFNYFSRISLRYKVMIPLNVVSLFLNIGLGVFLYKINYEKFQNSVKNKVESMESFLVNSSPIYILNWDLAALESFVKVAIDDEDIDSVTYFDNKGDALTKTKRKESRLNTLERKRVIKDGETPIASIVTGYNLNSANRASQEAAIYLVVGLIIVQLVLSLTLFFITNKISRPLEEVIKSLKRSTQKTNRIATQLDAVSQSLEDGVNSQSTSMQETVASMTEIKRMAKQSCQIVENAVHLGNASKKKAEEGAQIMVTLTNAIESIKNANNQLNEMVNIIKEISKKTNVINDIVFETRLLSFNASIEAARAGQHGKGFAVVAEEVGNLAQMSGEASKDISELLEKSNSKVVDIVALTTEKVKRGEEVYKDSLKAFQDILLHVHEIAQSLDEVTKSINEQLTGFEESTIALNEMKQVAFNNKEVAQTNNKVAKVLSEESKSINKYTEVIEIITHGISNALSLKKKKEENYIENLLSLKRNHSMESEKIDSEQRTPEEIHKEEVALERLSMKFSEQLEKDIRKDDHKEEDLDHFFKEDKTA